MDRMQTATEPGESSQRVRGLVLPVLLASLLASGRWQHPGDDVLRRALPWFEEPLVFLRSVGAMESESTSLDDDADDDRASRYFHVTRGTGHRLGLPWLDARLALLIAVNRSPGDDVAIALDYRGENGSPMVVASDAWTYPNGHLWRPVAPSFDAFASMLGITP
jgi:hypothetical protein